MTITVQHVVSALQGTVAEAHGSDRLLAGTLDDPVRAIAVSFMPSYQVIQEAVSLGATLLIVHEGIFYSHRHESERFADDPVARGKLDLLTRSGLAVYRCHDYWHRIQPDGIVSGLLRELGWETFVFRHDPTSSVVLLPEPMAVRNIVMTLKQQLGLPAVRVVGDLSLPCMRIGITVGYRGGGEHAIPLFQRDGLDLLIVGEGPEWETPEYVKDAIAQGQGTALVVVGHAESEVPGMRLLADRLRADWPQVPVAYIEEKPLFQVL